jgi:hypothetical protein
MKHRHLQERPELSSAAIDDIIERGGWEDWLALRDRTDSDRTTAERVLRVCEARGDDPYAHGGGFARRFERGPAVRFLRRVPGTHGAAVRRAHFFHAGPDVAAEARTGVEADHVGVQGPGRGTPQRNQACKGKQCGFLRRFHCPAPLVSAGIRPQRGLGSFLGTSKTPRESIESKTSILSIFSKAVASRASLRSARVLPRHGHFPPARVQSGVAGCTGSAGVPPARLNRNGRLQRLARRARPTNSDEGAGAWTRERVWLGPFLREIRSCNRGAVL